MYQHPEMKGKNVHQRYVASTHQKNATHMQRRISTDPPTIIGVRLVLFPVSGVAMAEGGLAGMLPAYSAGGGGGELGGREAEGTAAARGETMVAPGSLVVTSNTKTTCSPNETTSPAFKTRGPANR